MSINNKKYRGNLSFEGNIAINFYVSVDTVRVLDLAGDSGLGDGGRGVPQQEAVA